MYIGVREIDMTEKGLLKKGMTVQLCQFPIDIFYDLTS